MQENLENKIIMNGTAIPNGFLATHVTEEELKNKPILGADTRIRKPTDYNIVDSQGQTLIDLTKKEPRKKMPKIMQTIGAVAMTAYLAVMGAGCKKSPSGPDSPVPLNINIEIYNHTQGQRGAANMNVTSGDSIQADISIPGQVKLDNLSDAAEGIIVSLSAADTELQRMVVRENKTGRWLTYTTNSSTGVFPVRKEAETYTIYLMNANPNYYKIDYCVLKDGGRLEYAPHAKWKRQDRDGFTGPAGPINDTISQLNAALNPFGIRYGSFTEVSSNADFGVGYGYCSGYAGIHSSTLNWAGVNPDNSPTYQRRLQVLTTEIFELATLTAKLYDGIVTAPLITNPDGTLNQTGIDLLCYIWVKDYQNLH